MDNSQVETAAVVAYSTPNKATAPNFAEVGGLSTSFNSMMPIVFFSGSKKYLTS